MLNALLALFPAMRILMVPECEHIVACKLVMLRNNNLKTKQNKTKPDKVL